MLSETKYKLIYAVYCFGISLLLFGVLYMNFTRLYTSSFAAFGLYKVLKRNLMEVGIISAIVIVVCLFGIIRIGLRFSSWKCIYGVIPAAIIFLIEFFMIVMFHQIPLGKRAFAKLIANICIPGLSIVIVGLILFGVLLNQLSRINIIMDEDSEVVSAILISNIAVMLVTILSYILLC